MPAQMKTKSSTSCFREGNVLQPCRQSIKISKSLNFDVKLSQQATLDTIIHDDEDLSVLDTGSAVCVDYEDISPAATFQFQKQLPSIGSSVVGRSESLPSTAPTILETIFSPILEFDDVHCKPIHNSAGTNDKHTDVATDFSDDGTSSSSDYQTCNASDSMISDMGASSLSFDHNLELDDVLTGSWSSDYEYGGLDMLFDMEERYTILPFLEDSIETSNTQDGESVEEAVVNSVDAGLYLAIQQMKPSEQKTDLGCYFGDLDELDSFDPHLFIRNLPELSETYPSVWPMLVPKETQMRKPVTLVLDLDETLVHSTLDFCEDADFSFPVYFNSKEQIVYVRQRPHLHLFLDRVAKMFEVVIFTASLSIYAEQLLNILDPDHRLITHRVYRESCIFSDGSYTKDLTILGVDLAKVAIVDNSPQVFQLQVNNGIPIPSWFDDPSDSALISLLPFLETLANVEDVRPIIAKRFNNKELLLPHVH